MTGDGNEDGMSVERLATLLNGETGSDPKALPAKEPAATTETDDTQETPAVEANGEAEPGDNETEADATIADHEEDDAERSRRPSRSQRLKAQLERARAEIEALKSAPPPMRPSVKPEDAVTDMLRQRLGPPPKEADFPGDYLAYERAASAYQVAELMMKPQIAAESQRAQQAQQQAVQERIADFWEAAGEFAAKLPDLRAKIEGMPPPPDSVLELILDDAEKGPLVAYFLASNPRKSAEIARMSPRQQAVEYGRLSASISLPKPKAKQQAAKPAPIAPVKGQGTKPARSLMDLSHAEFSARIMDAINKG